MRNTGHFHGILLDLVSQNRNALGTQSLFQSNQQHRENQVRMTQDFVQDFSTECNLV